jgi:hypothetical protein
MVSNPFPHSNKKLWVRVWLCPFSHLFGMQSIHSHQDYIFWDMIPCTSISVKHATSTFMLEMKSKEETTFWCSKTIVEVFHHIYLGSRLLWAAGTTGCHIPQDSNLNSVLKWHNFCLLLSSSTRFSLHINFINPRQSNFMNGNCLLTTGAMLLNYTANSTIPLCYE